MKIGTRGHYSVIAMVELARQTSSGKPVSLSRVAEKQNIPLNYLEQLFVSLKKERLVKGVRGAFGGYFLAKDADQISVWEILQASGEATSFNQCSGDEKKPYCLGRDSYCDMHDLWTESTKHMQAMLKKVSLKKVLQKRSLENQDSLNFFGPHTTYIEEQKCPSLGGCKNQTNNSGGTKSSEKDVHLS